MMDFGEKIESIRGTRDYCIITFSNGNTLKCYGELLIQGFCIYKNSLDLTEEEIIKLQKMIEKKASEFDHSTKITIE